MFRISGMEWSCNTGKGGVFFVSFFGLAGLQDSGMWVATQNDSDCRKAMALGLCIWTSLQASRRPGSSTDL